MEIPDAYSPTWTFNPTAQKLILVSTGAIPCTALRNMPRWAREVRRAKSVAGTGKTEVESGRPERRPAPSAAESQRATLSHPPLVTCH